MENIRKKLLVLMLSLEMGIISKFMPRRIFIKTYDELSFESPVISEVVDSKDYEEFDISESGENASKILDDKINEQMLSGCMGVRLLFSNFRFLAAVVTKKSDVIALLLEKYFIDGKINSTTIEAFLSNKHFSFSDEERNKLMAYVESDPKRIVLA